MRSLADSHLTLTTLFYDVLKSNQLEFKHAWSSWFLRESQERMSGIIKVINHKFPYLVLKFEYSDFKEHARAFYRMHTKKKSF